MSKFYLNKIIFLVLGLILCFIPDFLSFNQELSYDAKMVLRMLILMIFLWISEIIPISITAFIPILFSPLFIEIEVSEVFSYYASPVVFLLLGGFIIAQGFEKSKLHERIALKTILSFGHTKERILVSVIMSTAFFSMWLSNTATCLLMLPIVKNILDNNFDNYKSRDFAKILILSIAYSSSIGGMATPIGTIPNAVMVGFLSENHGIEIDFVKWFLYISPLVLVLLVFLCIFFRFKFKDPKDTVNNQVIKSKYKKLGKISDKEKITIFILIFTLCLWIFKKYINDLMQINLTDPSIAIFGSFLFFIIPLVRSESILESNWFNKIPWNVLVLFGGGLSMASMIMTSGLGMELSKIFNLISLFELITIIFLIALITSFMTEFTSNTATTFLLLPLLSIFAQNNQIELLQVLFPFVLAASCAFMMPIATPPNAIVYASNMLKVSFMVSNGFFINIISVIVISIYVFFFKIM